MSEKLTVDVQDHVAVVRLNRPEKQNALDLETFSALAETGEELASRSGIRVVVLGAHGDHFCAGIDTSVFGSDQLGPELMRAKDASPANFFQHAAYVWREIPVPVVCAVKGNTFGGGLQVALGADMRIGSPNARLSVMEVVWGLIPDIAITATARGLVRPDVLKELALTGRIIDGTEGLACGLLSRLSDDPDAEALTLATEIASRSPDATRGIKRLINDAWQINDADALALEASLQMAIMARPNQSEAVRSRFEKRAPRFKDD